MIYNQNHKIIYKTLEEALELIITFDNIDEKAFESFWVPSENNSRLLDKVGKTVVAMAYISKGTYNSTTTMSITKH